MSAIRERQVNVTLEKPPKSQLKEDLVYECHQDIKSHCFVSGLCTSNETLFVIHF